MCAQYKELHVLYRDSAVTEASSTRDSDDDHVEDDCLMDDTDGSDDDDGDHTAIQEASSSPAPVAVARHKRSTKTRPTTQAANILQLLMAANEDRRKKNKIDEMRAGVEEMRAQIEHNRYRYEKRSQDFIYCKMVYETRLQLQTEQRDDGYITQGEYHEAKKRLWTRFMDDTNAANQEDQDDL